MGAFRWYSAVTACIVAGRAFGPAQRRAGLGLRTCEMKKTIRETPSSTRRDPTSLLAR